MENKNVIKVTLTEYLLERALVGVNWPKVLVATLIKDFNSGGAERFAMNCENHGLLNHTYLQGFMTDLRMLGFGMLADAVEKRKRQLRQLEKMPIYSR